MSVDRLYHEEVEGWLDTGALIQDAIGYVAERYEVPDSIVLSAYYRVRNAACGEPMAQVIDLAAERRRRRRVPQ